MPIHPKAIVFDYGNVLSAPQSAAEIQEMAQILDLPTTEFTKHYWTFREAYDAAEFPPDEYWNRVAQLAGRTLSEHQIRNLIQHDNLSWLQPRANVAEWGRSLRKAGFRIALLSNMPV